MCLFRPARRALALLGFLVLIVTIAPLDAVWLRFCAGPWNDPKGDVLIVLGADLVGDAIGAVSYWRSVYAVRAWREGGFKTVVIAGGFNYEHGPTVADRMRDFLICQGIPANDIVVETKSLTTRENALYAADLIRGMPGTKVLLTSDLHMFRAHRVFQKIGLDVQPRPIPDALKRADSWVHRYGVFLEIIVESTKTTYYWLRGWI